MEKRQICIVTGTRAEYHQLSLLIKALLADNRAEVKLAVTGSHLNPKYGNTYQDIEKDGFIIDKKIPILEQSDSERDVCAAISRAIEGFCEYFTESRPDMIVLLGDRYELLAVAIAAMNMRIPIAHLYGGDTTEGAIDECIRHSITKMSYLHFVSCERSRHRVIQMGEAPDRVFNVGALGVENTIKQQLLSREALEENLGFFLGENFAVVTFHPVTLEKGTVQTEFGELLTALESMPDMKILFTKANADTGGLIVNEMIDNYVETHQEQSAAVYSLGIQRYFTALHYAKLVIGNSSSGIYETPSFRVATINIGDRQRGRTQAENVINCTPDADAILEAVNQALSKPFQERLLHVKSPYGEGGTSEEIAKKIVEVLLEDKIDLKKKFYDIDYCEV